MRRIAWILILLLGGVGLAQVQAVATLGFVADMLRNVGGARVKVTQIVPSSADPHSFEPKPSVLRAIAAAQILVANGLGLEPFLDKLAAQLPQGAKAVSLGTAIPQLLRKGASDDPHVWLDPTYGVRYAEAIRDVLSATDPAGKTLYAANAASYIGQIKAADAVVRACLEPIPKAQRLLVSQHEALGYFLRHYGIQSIGSIADYAAQERGPKSFAKLAQAMKQAGVKVVFAEPQFSGAQAKALAEATGARVERIYSDAFDDRVNTYLGLLQANGKAVCASFSR